MLAADPQPRQPLSPLYATALAACAAGAFAERGLAGLLSNDGPMSLLHFTLRVPHDGPLPDAPGAELELLPEAVRALADEAARRVVWELGREG